MIGFNQRLIEKEKSTPHWRSWLSSIVFPRFQRTGLKENSYSIKRAGAFCLLLVLIKGWMKREKSTPQLKSWLYLFYFGSTEPD